MKSKEYKLVKTKQKWIKNIKILVYYFALFRGKISNKKTFKKFKKSIDICYQIQYNKIRSTQDGIEMIKSTLKSKQ